MLVLNLIPSRLVDHEFPDFLGDMLLLPLLILNLISVDSVTHFRDVAQFSAKLSSGLRRKRDVCSTVDIVLSNNNIRAIPKPKSLCNNCCPLNFKTDIRLFLYTKNNPERGKQLSKFKAGSVTRAGLKPNYPTVIYIHGFLEQSPEGDSGKTIREAYLNRPDWHNVIIVDWSQLSAAPWYLEAARNTRIVGKVLANFLMINHVSGDLPISSVHVIGFSLGAQAAGFAGKDLVGIRIPRITGLDPAAPLFPLRDADNRLSKNDAEFVDVIHTSWETLGFPISIGHADFYANYGRFYQPGCTMEELVNSRQLENIFSCSHVRAWQYYSESVKNPYAFPSISCQVARQSLSTCQSGIDAYMGYNISRYARGEFYLQTNLMEPFGKPVEEWELKLP